MAEVQSQGAPTPQAAPAAAPAEPQPSGLEKVYADFGVEDTAATFSPQSPSPAPATPQAPAIPQGPKIDPFDPNFGLHMSEIARRAAETQNALTQTRGELTQLQRQLHSQKVEADIKQAVEVISKQAGIEPEIAEVALEAKARQDQRFRTLWENRAKNPKAWQAAQQAFATEAQQKFTVRQDPQLVENQRAMKVSQQAMATTQRVSEQDKWAAMTPAERATERERIKRMG